jgi:zinc transporter 5
MSVQKAVVYNIVSSVLSFTGMAVGVWIGEHEAATQYIYAFTAGTFLYISLADLVSMHRDYNAGCSLNHKYQARGLLVQCSMMRLCTYGSSPCLMDLPNHISLYTMGMAPLKFRWMLVTK